MSRRSLRRVALVLIALLGFVQVSIALAACTMDRGALARVDDHSAAMECGLPEQEQSTARGSMDGNLCLAHCTADLQSTGLSAPTVLAVSQTPFFLVPRSESPAEPLMPVLVPPPGMPPPRILLHSYLI